MDNPAIRNNPSPSVEELQREIRSLKRKLSLAETNLVRARMIGASQERADSIFNNAIQKELRFFKLVLENATNILLLFDFDGRFAYASDTFLTDAGIANFGLIGGRHFQEVLQPIISGESLSKFTEAVDRAVRLKSTATLEEQIDFNNQGRPRTFSIIITPMTDEDGESTGIMALFNDITEINDALEAANRANLAKTNFLANMSHEIRTPLNAIIGMAAIAQGSMDMDKIHYCLDKINDSSKHLLGVINDILDMSKIESNHFELSYSEFVFETMLLRIIDVMRFKIEEKDIAFSLYCDPDIPYVIYSDEQRLAQVIMNLLSNAIKFTPQNGTISLRAEVESYAGDEYSLRITVKDSGIGISEEHQRRLFTAFTQADSSISRKFGGTGLGLVISRNIINLLNGDIKIASQEGKGAAFTFNILTRSCHLAPVVKANRKGVRLLVVDDMPDILFSFSMYAKKLGVSCTTASNAEEAAALLKQQSFNIIFIDWKMPGTDGLMFAKSLGHAADSRIVIIMISAADWADIEKEAKSAGVKEFISKPILLPVLEGLLDKYCEDLQGDEAESYEDFSGKTILLVDDIEINREIIIALLESTGIHIDCAENGKDAIEKYAAARTPYDLIFMDVQMPEMDGYEATQRIRAMEEKNLRRVPIVAMTANVFKEDVERCLASGMDDHVGKPVNVEEISEKIRIWTSHPSADKP